MKLVIVILSVFLSACSSLPVAIKAAPAQDIQLKQVVSHVTEYIGKPVRWGGQIVEVDNDDNYSTLQIVQFPLNSFGRPIVTKSSQGRFLGQSSQFFDPVVYKEGSLITFAGSIHSEVTRIVDEKSLILPVITITESHLWSSRQRYDNYYGEIGYPYYFRYGYYSSYYHYPYRYPYYRGYGFRHHYHQYRY
ncbi:MAG: Slp family lipoprotein [Methylococcaceae bacterium]|nr:Slp family lipoprotein [Methylococcaceae bacterium]